MRALNVLPRILFSSAVLGLLLTAMTVASALAGDIQPPVPK